MIMRNRMTFSSTLLLLFPSLLLLLLTSLSIRRGGVNAFSTATRPRLFTTFTTTTRRRQQHGPAATAASVLSFGLSLTKSSHPEYSVVEQNDDNEEENTTRQDGVESPVSAAATAAAASSSTASGSSPTTSSKQNHQYQYSYHYTALSPGTVVQIQVGDTRLARKAWKKRRRSGSPLLVPCSILAVDANSALLWNVLYLLQKFGQASNNNKNKRNEITLTLSELLQRHATHIKFNLKHYIAANADLGYDNVKDLLRNILNERVQESYGIKLVIPTKHDNNNEENNEEEDWYLTAPISRFRAQQRASQAAILQFSTSDMTSMATSSASSRKNENENDGSASTAFQHTGMVRNKQRTDKTTTNTNADDKTTNSNSNNSNNNNNNMYMLQPLSAALRVSRDDLDNTTGGLVIQNDSLHPAVVLEYDLTGDNGAPLLVLSLNPRRQVRDGLKIISSSSNTGKSNTNTRISNNSNKNRMPIKYMVQDLQVGKGPLQAKVVRLIKGGALVDCGIGRKQQSSSSSNNKDDDDLVPVLGFLRFKDAVRLPATTKTTTTAIVDDDENDGDDEDDDLEEDVPDDAPWEEILSFEDLDDDEEEDDDEVDTITPPATTASTTKSPSSSSRKPRVEDLDLSALLLEDDDEKEGGVIDTEDVTYLFQQNEDGSYTYTDPETGYSQVILNDDFDTDDDDDEDYDDEEDSPTADLFDMERKNDLFISKPAPTTTATTQRRRNTAGSTTATKMSSGLQRKMLKVGELIDVYVLSASKQSHQVKVTMNPKDVCGKSARDLKKQEAVNKKLGRLAKQLGFKHDGSIVDTTTGNNYNSDDDDDLSLSSFSLHRAMEYWKGREMNGIVKATSQTGDWLYVQPQQDDENKNNGQRSDGGFLPVGVASVQIENKGSDDAAAKEASSLKEFRQGDPVRIRIQGIDRERGQLSLRVLHKLKP